MLKRKRAQMSAPKAIQKEGGSYLVRADYRLCPADLLLLENSNEKNCSCIKHGPDWKRMMSLPMEKLAHIPKELIDTDCSLQVKKWKDAGGGEDDTQGKAKGRGKQLRVSDDRNAGDDDDGDDDEGDDYEEGDDAQGKGGKGKKKWTGPLIPKPKGQAGTDYTLQEEMRLWSTDHQAMDRRRLRYNGYVVGTICG
jgi:hypothetical protein